jgi:tRNA A37 threonylcarbamoyladenosine dehydratase
VTDSFIDVTGAVEINKTIDDLRELCRQMTRISCVFSHETFATIRTQSEIKQKKEDFQSNENIGTLQGIMFQN